MFWLNGKKMNRAQFWSALIKTGNIKERSTIRCARWIKENEGEKHPLWKTRAGYIYAVVKGGK